MTESGDIAVAPNGDLALTETNWRDYAQQAYLIVMTQLSDFSLYPTLGSEMESLVGMAQTPATGAFGCALIKAAIQRSIKFNGIPVDVKAVPVSQQGIRFDIYITAGSKTEMLLSIEQNLGIEGDA